MKSPYPFPGQSDILSHCSWCRRDIEIPDGQSGNNQEKIPTLCTECLLDLLPTTLKTHTHTKKLSNERRTATRYPVKTKVFISLSKQRNRILQAIILDISDTGTKCRVDLKAQALVGEKITIGVIGRSIIYKTSGNVIYCLPLKENKPLTFILGIKLQAIYQEMRVENIAT